MSSNQHVRVDELRALPLSFMLLLVPFGAIVAAVCPLMLGLLAVGFALATSALVALYWSPSILLQNVVSFLGPALEIDYTLLIIKRFRAELTQSDDVALASFRTVRHAGPSVVMSGAAVALGFSALLVVPVQEPFSVGAGGLLATVFAVLLSTRLLAALLHWASR